MKTTAKVFCSQVHDNGEYSRIDFMPDYNDEANKEWSYFTPSLDFHMNVRTEIASRFEHGQKFTVTFELETPASK